MKYEPTGRAAAWPIAAAMLPFKYSQDADASHWRWQLDQVAFEGFDGIDLTDNWVKVGNLSDERLDELKSVLDEVGIRVVATSAIRCSPIDPETGLENLAYLHRTIDASKKLGTNLVSLGLHRPLLPAQQEALWFWTQPGPVDSQDPENWQLAVDRIRELSDHAASLDMELTLEMYEDTLIGTADGAVKLVEAIDRENVGLNPDLGNLFRLHREIEDFNVSVAKCMPHANYWHVKNYFRDVDKDGHVVSLPAPMAMGSANYREAIQIAIDAGYTGPFCVEHYGGDGLTVAAMNRDYIRRMLAVALNEMNIERSEGAAK